MYKKSCLQASSAVALVAIIHGAPAWAQVTAADVGASSSRVEDIIVTATKRDESLVKVPVSVSVFTESTIAERGITRPADFLGTTPNVTFIEDNAGEAYVNIRGQTSVRNSDPNVAIVIDGVALSSVKPFNQDLFGIQQIEVLKGPQSALYGRNAAAGAIVVTTKKPGDTFEGNVVAAYDNFDTKRMSSIISGPIAEGLGMSLAGSFRDTDGPFTNVVTGEKVARLTNYNGRGRLLYESKDGLTIDLKVGGHSSKGGGVAYNAQVAGSGIGGLPANPAVLDANFAEMDYVSNVRGLFREKFFDATLKIDYDFDWATITSISAYNRLNQVFGSDSPPYIPDTGSPDANVQQFTYLDKNYSQEVRLSSASDGRFRWQVGFYYLRFTRNQTSKVSVDNEGTLPDDPRVIEPVGSVWPTLSFSNPLYKTTSYAPFASFQFDVTDQLHINVAGRYDTEKRSVTEAASAAINPLTGVSYNNCIALTGQAIEECNASRTFRQFEPKGSVSYDVSQDASVYASFGRGFKSGGFNPIGSRATLIGAAIGAGLPASSVYVQDNFDKEVSTSYEVGAKAHLFDQRLSINIALFQTHVSGAQQFEFYPTVGLQTTVGIDKVKLKGFDLDFDARLPTGTRVFGGFGYTHGRVSSFAGNPAFVGNVAPGAFKSTLTLGASQQIELAKDIILIPRVEFNHFGSIWWDVANTPGTRRKPLSLVKARLSLKGGDRWEISAFGDNLTNKKYFQEVVPLLGSFTVNYRGPTRSYGLEARVNF